jgi:hypothetical protein
MKTCKDCIYWVDINHPSAAPIDGSKALHIGQGECRLYPEPRENVFANHWCGQLKKKVNPSDHQWTKEEMERFKTRDVPALKINKITTSWKDE